MQTTPSKHRCMSEIERAGGANRASDSSCVNGESMRRSRAEHEQTCQSAFHFSPNSSSLLLFCTRLSFNSASTHSLTRTLDFSCTLHSHSCTIIAIRGAASSFSQFPFLFSFGCESAAVMCCRPLSHSLQL